MDILKQLGQRIQFLRERKGITQEELSNKADVNPKYISAIERGQRNATVHTLEKIAKGLEVDCFELFLFSEEDGGIASTQSAIESLLKESELKTLKLCLQFLRTAQGV